MRKLSGFTLVECLVALMVLGIAALTLAQVYAAVAKGTRDNEYMNISLAEQMKYVEKRDNSAAVSIEPTVSGETSSHELDDDSYHVIINGGPVKLNADGSIAGIATNKYLYGVNMYILYSRDIHDEASTTNNDDGTTEVNDDYAYDTESSGKLRYKYLQPRPVDQTT
jgi:prepilin-type N-terminal cleavage/methylation domain-containing protein